MIALSAQFTTKESNEISRLQEKITSNTSSALEVQIAQAQLDELRRSKGAYFFSSPFPSCKLSYHYLEPTLHNHKHNLRGVGEVGSGNSNIFHDDEAFERYNMGAAVGHHPGSKVANQAAADRASIKNSAYHASSASPHMRTRF